VPFCKATAEEEVGSIVWRDVMLYLEATVVGGLATSVSMIAPMFSTEIS
jgi:hypothetical protein